MSPFNALIGVPKIIRSFRLAATPMICDYAERFAAINAAGHVGGGRSGRVDHMASARDMLARGARLEQARAAPLSPFEAMYGSFDAFEAETLADVDAGKLDGDDMPIVLASLRRWQVQGLWSLWHRDRVWQRNG